MTDPQLITVHCSSCGASFKAITTHPYNYGLCEKCFNFLGISDADGTIGVVGIELTDEHVRRRWEND